MTYYKRSNRAHDQDGPKKKQTKKTDALPIRSEEREY